MTNSERTAEGIRQHMTNKKSLRVCGRAAPGRGLACRTRPPGAPNPDAPLHLRVHTRNTEAPHHHTPVSLGGALAARTQIDAWVNTRARRPLSSRCTTHHLRTVSEQYSRAALGGKRPAPQRHPSATRPARRPQHQPADRAAAGVAYRLAARAAPPVDRE